MWLCILCCNFDRLISLLLFYVVATSKVISGLLPTCDHSNSWWLCNDAPFGHQASSTMTWYATQSHYPATEPSLSCPPTLIMLSAWLWSDKYPFLSHGFDSARVQTRKKWIARSPKMGDGHYSFNHLSSGEPLRINVGEIIQTPKEWTENWCPWLRWQ